MSPLVVAAELRPALRRAPRLPLGSAAVRRLVRTATRLMRPAKVAGGRRERIEAGGARLILYRPDSARSDAALLWIHGGGYLIGRADVDDRFCAETSAALGLTIASIDYRLAPEHRYPAALDDCDAAWRWLREASVDIGIDPERIVVGGQSAGGGLAACLVLRLRDRGERPAGQWLFSPMLDDRTAARRELDLLDHAVWDNRLNAIGWRAYLGAEPGGPAIPHDGAAARCDDLSGLPPTWIGTGEIDLFAEEDLTYARRLRAAGVAVAVSTVPNAPHGFESWAAHTTLAKAYVAEARNWLAALTTR